MEMGAGRQGLSVIDRRLAAAPPLLGDERPKERPSPGRQWEA